MYKRIIINLLLIIGLVVLQVSLISGLPAGFNNMNLIIVVLIFILGLSGFWPAFWWSAGAGILLDIYSFMPFGIYAFSIIITVLIVNFFLDNFFTNRSLYSFLLLTFFGTIISRLLVILLNYSFYGLTAKDFFIKYEMNFAVNEFKGLFLNFALVIIIFYLLNFSSGYFKPVFLKTK